MKFVINGIEFHMDKENKDTFNWRYTFRKRHNCKCKVVTVLQNGEQKVQKIIDEHSHDPNDIAIATVVGKDEVSFEMTNPLDLSKKETKENVLELSNVLRTKVEALRRYNVERDLSLDDTYKPLKSELKFKDRKVSSNPSKKLRIGENTTTPFTSKSSRWNG